MKKTLTLFSLILVCSFVFNTLNAQNLDVRGYFGFSVLELTNGHDNFALIDDIIHRRKVNGSSGYQFGVAATFGKQFYVQPGVAWTTMNATIKDLNSQTGEEFESSPKVSVISVPLSVGFRLINPETENLINVRIFGGLVGHHVTNVENSSGDHLQLEKDDFKNLLIATDFGLGLDVWFLFLDVGYEIGLSHMLNEGGNDTKHSRFFGNIGVKIGF